MSITEKLLRKWNSTLWMSSSICPGDMDGLVQDSSKSSVLAMELLLPCTKPLIYASPSGETLHFTRLFLFDWSTCKFNKYILNSKNLTFMWLQQIISYIIYSVSFPLTYDRELPNSLEFSRKMLSAIHGINLDITHTVSFFFFVFVLI